MTHHALDGVAVVSDIVASTDPKSAAERLNAILKDFKTNYIRSPLGLRDNLAVAEGNKMTVKSILDGVVQLVTQIRGINPLVHQVSAYVDAIFLLQKLTYVKPR